MRVALLLNSLRKRASAPGYPPGQVFHRLTASVSDAEWIVRFYYGSSIYIATQLLVMVDDISRETGTWDFLWPLAWVENFDIRLVLSLLSIACFVSSLVAFHFYGNVAARVLFSFLFFMTATVPNSVGGINHPYHAWIWVGFAFVFLPNGRAYLFDRADQLSYLTVIRAAQAIFLLFYTMTGTWKLFFGLVDGVAGRVGNFSPQALPLQLADRIVQTRTDPVLANFVIDNLWLAWPMFLIVIYIQVVSVLIPFRSRLHVLWGYLQIGFHLGTWLLMDIVFAEHILLLIILLVLSPQRQPLKDIVGALGDLPLLGWMFRRYVPAKEAAIAIRGRNGQASPGSHL